MQVAVELFNDLVNNNVVVKEDETIDDEMLKTDQHKQNDWQLSFDSQSHSSEHIQLIFNVHEFFTRFSKVNDRYKFFALLE